MGHSLKSHSGLFMESNMVSEFLFSETNIFRCICDYKPVSYSYKIRNSFNRFPLKEKKQIAIQNCELGYASSMLDCVLSSHILKQYFKVF